MKKHYKTLSIILILCGVFLGYYVTHIKNINYNIDVTENFFKTLNFDLNVFVKIFKNNLIVGVLLSLGGYFTSGILTVLVLLWNGIIIGSLFFYFIVILSILMAYFTVEMMKTGTHFKIGNFYNEDAQHLSDGRINNFNTAGFGNDFGYDFLNTFIGLEYKFQIGITTFKPMLYAHFYSWQTRQFDKKKHPD